MPINAGIRSDVTLGLKTKRFWAASVNAAVVTLLGIASATAVRLTDGAHRVADPYAFCREVLTTALVALGVERIEAARLAKTAMDNRRKELKP
jgi:hypothetical protein